MKTASTHRIHLSALGLAAATALSVPAQAQLIVWDGGNYFDQPRPATINGPTTLIGTAGFPKTLNGNLVNNGSIVWQTTETLNFSGTGTTLRNNGLFDMQGDGWLLSSSSTQLFDNTGTLRKSAGGGDLTVAVSLTNRAGATLQSDSGRIVYRSASSFEAGSIFAGAGRHVFENGNATFSFGGDFAGNGRLVFQQGTYAATTATRPLSDFSFSGGTFSGPWAVAQGSTMTGTAGFTKAINGSFTNDGSIAWQTTEVLNFSGTGTTLHNNGLFDMQGDGWLQSGSSTQLFDNTGTLRKSAGGNDLTVAVSLTNRAGATLQSDSGRIVYRSASSFEAGSIFAGAGHHVFENGNATFSFGGDFAGNGRLVFQQGTYAATTATRPLSDFTFSGGTFSGPWAVANGTTMTGTAGFAKAINGSFTNDGSIAWQTTEVLSFSGTGTTLRNNGLFDMQGDGWLLSSSSTQLFDNTGTLRKSAGNEDLTVAVSLLNTGAIESLAGTVVLPGNWTNNGVLRGTAAYRTNTLTNAGSITPGASAAPQIATLAINAALVQSPAGRLSFEVGAGGLADLLNVSGVVGFDGLLEVLNFAGYVPTVGDTFRVMNFASYSGALMDIVELGFAPGVQFEAVYAAQHLDLRVVAVPEPATWLMLLGGIALLRSARRGKPG